MRTEEQESRPDKDTSIRSGYQKYESSWYWIVICQFIQHYRSVSHFLIEIK